MAIEDVRNYFRKFNIEDKILEFEQSSATVDLAAMALNVEPDRIAKTLSFKNDEGAILLVTSGKSRVDNKKFKSEFGYKAKMLTADEVINFTGHQIGGVCPFGLKNSIKVYLDISLKKYDTVYPACGSDNSAIELTCL
ncbi:YbaK/EbsC family protein, partial [Romboutsia weinsteinii]